MSLGCRHKVHLSDSQVPGSEYDPCRMLDQSIVERVAEINTRKSYLSDGKTIDCIATNRWREQGIPELPHPPAGHEYLLDISLEDSPGVVRLVAHASESYEHKRRKVTGASDIEHRVLAGLKLHMAEKKARAREASANAK